MVIIGFEINGTMRQCDNIHMFYIIAFYHFIILSLLFRPMYAIQNYYFDRLFTFGSGYFEPGIQQFVRHW